MTLRKGQLSIIIFNAVVLSLFGILFAFRRNVEFVIYIAVLVGVALLIYFTNDKVKYPNIVLWGLTLWNLMHMAGGGIIFKEERLYGLILIPLTEDIFRYDQLVHIVGFCVATLAMYILLKPHLKTNKKISIYIVIVMAGLGVGALNEILEFFITVILPDSGVGGYVNTSLDLVSDLIGAIIALIFVKKDFV